MRISLAIFLLFISATVFAQKDTVRTIMQHDSLSLQNASNKTVIVLDTPMKFNPHIAAVRSAIIPGWGQIYNRQYWKLPLVYGALGTTAGIFIYNLGYYKKLRKAYTIRLSGDTASFNQIDPTFQNLSTDAIKSYRDEFRQNIDYSALFFLLFWGLNVVDANVTAHLRSFDISNDLSLEIKPQYNPWTNSSGLSLVLNIGKNNTKSLPSLP